MKNVKYVINFLCKMYKNISIFNCAESELTWFVIMSLILWIKTDWRWRDRRSSRNLNTQYVTHWLVCLTKLFKKKRLYLRTSRVKFVQISYFNESSLDWNYLSLTLTISIMFEDNSDIWCLSKIESCESVANSCELRKWSTNRLRLFKYDASDEITSNIA